MFLKKKTKKNMIEFLRIRGKYESLLLNVESDLEPDNEIAVLYDSNNITKPINLKIVTAAKQHVCNCCNRAINKGEVYHTHRLLFNNKFITYKTCIDCLSIINNFFDGVFGYSYDYMIEKLTEHIKSMPENERFLSENLQNSLSFKSIRLLHDLMDKVDLQEDMKEAIDEANKKSEGETE